MAKAKKNLSLKTSPKSHLPVGRQDFSKKEAISFGFKLAKKNVIFFIGVFIIVIFVFCLSSAFQAGITLQNQAMPYILLNILSFIVNTIVSIGLIKISLKFIDNKKPKFSDLFYIKPLVNFILGTLIRTVITVIGFILFIIPGIIFSIRLQFVTYLIVEKNMPPVDAIKKSWEMTKGNTQNLFLFCILLFLVNVLGALLLLVGLFITLPLTMLATTFVYRKLLLHSKAA